MRTGERGAAYRDEETGDWIPVIVLRGLLDRPKSKLYFGTSPRFPGPRFSRPPAGDPLAVLQRRSDGVRLFLRDDWSLEEVSG